MPWPSPASVATSNSLCLNPFQSEQLAEFQAKRREAMMPAEGESFDPTRLPEIIKQLKEEGQTRLAGFLTPDQVDQYKSRSSRSVQVMSMGGGGVSGASSEGLNFSIQLPSGVIGASAMQMTVGSDVGDAFIFGESKIFTEGEEWGEIIFDAGELLLPPLPEE
jgi:hypothetical protein